MTNARMPSCRTIRSQLSEALDGRLGRVESREFHQHLIACPACRAEYDKLAQLQQLTGSLRDEPVRDDFRERLLARIEAGEGARPEILRHPTSFAHRAKFFASGAATAAALLISFWLIVDGLKEGESTSLPDNNGEVASTFSNDADAIDALPVGNLDAVDPNRFGLEAVQRSQEFYEGLRSQAARVASHPPKFAMEKLAQQSQALIESIRFLDVIDGTLLELPGELRSNLRTAASKAKYVLATAEQQDASRDSVQRVVDELLREIPSLSASSRSIKIRLHGNGIDLQRIVTGRARSTDEAHRFMTYAWKHLVPRSVRDSKNSIRVQFTLPAVPNLQRNGR